MLKYNLYTDNRNVLCTLCVQACEVPAEVQQRPCGGGYSLCRPAQEVELSEGTSFLGLDVLQVETPHQEVITPDMLRDQVHLSEIIKCEHNIWCSLNYIKQTSQDILWDSQVHTNLINVVERRALIGPIPITLLFSILNQSRHHHYDCTPALPNHLCNIHGFQNMPFTQYLYKCTENK